MTTSSSNSQCEAVAKHLQTVFSKKMYFRACFVANDDAGNHVELRIRRADLMGEPPPHIGTIDGVRVCLVILG